MGEYKLIIRVDSMKRLSPAQRQRVRELVVEFIEILDVPNVPELTVVNSKFLNVDWMDNGKKQGGA